MKIVSFNINGLRARIHQLKEIIKFHTPDIIGLQETKVDDTMFPIRDLMNLGYEFFYYGQKKHYGVAIFTKIMPVTILKGFPTDNIYSERRLIIVEIPSPIGNIVVINGYFPQGENRNHPTKFSAKKKFFCDLRNYLLEILIMNKFVLIMGDINITGTDLDIGIGEQNRKRWLQMGKCGFLPEEREWISSLFKVGMIDIWRQQHPKINNCFSWFDYRSKGFYENRGLRIDLLLVTKELASYCIATGIDYAIRSMDKSSDHAPVWLKFQF
ncbi:exodeoxyribonuclease III [Candidatus Pantoea edessiphila]|uniref:Exodeoxyribonuclease III n=1 Tax=Candidatus Pantoea edessiphila TaxID=2044610 RepID=A0A2P5SYN3_9GAMM|nr:exodeoxyribonuclease III [Candidatus Pantoea edessiphila]MBK4775421.1 exodeoxyribonuclease III [Pantoea sp. Edef]PPI87449.1 exodeoxyribonuclease III [Candidatus Pantoea edessiphila]